MVGHSPDQSEHLASRDYKRSHFILAFRVVQILRLFIVLSLLLWESLLTHVKIIKRPLSFVHRSLTVTNIKKLTIISLATMSQYQDNGKNEHYYNVSYYAYTKG